MRGLCSWCRNLGCGRNAEESLRKSGGGDGGEEGGWGGVPGGKGLLVVVVGGREREREGRDGWGRRGPVRGGTGIAIITNRCILRSILCSMYYSYMVPSNYQYIGTL